MLENKKLVRALHKVNRSVNKIESFIKINTGINNEVYKLKDINDNLYALKFYRRIETNDKRDRYHNESTFLSKLKNYKLNSIPELIYTCKESRWNLLSWISGEPVNELTLQDIEEIAKFIFEINQNLRSEDKRKFPLASEALISLKYLIENLYSRLNALMQKKPINSLDKLINKWIHNKLYFSIQKASKELEGKKNLIHWYRKDTCSIISPSDVGIHNMIRCNSGLNFIDFEYAGRDDMCKLIGDWIVQPQNPLNKELEEHLIQTILAYNFSIDEGWEYRLKDIKYLLQLKWVTIMLNPYLNKEITFDCWKKIQNYYNSFN